MWANAPSAIRGFELTGGGGRPPPPVGGPGAQIGPKGMFNGIPGGNERTGFHGKGCGDLSEMGKGPMYHKYPPGGFGFSKGTDPYANWTQTKG